MKAFNLSVSNLRKKKVINLFFTGKYTLKEIAYQVGISIPSVNKIITDELTRKRLKKQLKNSKN